MFQTNGILQKHTELELDVFGVAEKLVKDVVSSLVEAKIVYSKNPLHIGYLNRKQSILDIKEF